MNKKSSVARLADAPVAPGAHSARWRRFALFAALCLVATSSTAPILIGHHSGRLQFQDEYLAPPRLDELTFEALGDLLAGVSNPLAVNWLSAPAISDVAGAVEYMLPVQLTATDESTDLPLRRAYLRTDEAGLIDLFIGTNDAGSMIAMSDAATINGMADGPAAETPPAAGAMVAAVHPPMLLGGTPGAGVPEANPATDGRKNIPPALVKRATLGSAVRVDEGMPQPSGGAPDLPWGNGLADDLGFTLDTSDSATGQRTHGTLDVLDDAAVGAGGSAVDVDNIVLAAMTTTGPLGASPEFAQTLAPFEVAAVVPEPTTLAIVALGIVLLGISLRKR